jgi:hypothetical protein
MEASGQTRHDDLGPLRSTPPVYEPLSIARAEIRVIEIVESEGSQGQLECVLHTVSISENPDFAALSYVWGDPNTREEISVNGNPFLITKNLVGALKWVKHHWKQSFPESDPAIFRLWVDAICINQSDPDERNHQVQRMKDVCSKATIVIASVTVDDVKHVSVSLRIVRSIAC